MAHMTRSPEGVAICCRPLIFPMDNCLFFPLIMIINIAVCNSDYKSGHRLSLLIKLQKIYNLKLPARARGTGATQREQRCK